MGAARAEPRSEHEVASRRLEARVRALDEPQGGGLRATERVDDGLDYHPAFDAQRAKQLGIDKAWACEHHGRLFDRTRAPGTAPTGRVTNAQVVPGPQGLVPFALPSHLHHPPPPPPHLPHL